MMKRNQISLILLTVIAMLTVYYIKTTPEETGLIDDDVSSVGDFRNEEYTAMRLSVEEERNSLIMVFQDIMGDEESTLEEKTLAISAMQEIVQISEKEQLLEMEIIDFGYDDAFVHSSGNEVTVQILTDQFSAQESNEIVMMTLMEFGSDVQVTLKYDTAETEVVNK